jgi:hypothetical protein
MERLPLQRAIDDARFLRCGWRAIAAAAGVSTVCARTVYGPRREAQLEVMRAFYAARRSVAVVGPSSGGVQ